MLTNNDFIDLWKPTFPFATDDFKNGMRRMKRENAMTKRFIETTPKKLRNLITLDIDLPESEWHLKSLIHDDGLIPEPSFITINPASEHAQVGYFVNGSIQSPKAVDFFNDISTGLQIIASGDACYGGRTMRNPLHDYQRTLWGTDKLYSLKELNEYAVKAKTFDVPVDNDTIVGSGRNEAMFEALRKWAYRERLKYTTYEAWAIAAQERGNELNFSLENPLSHSEVRAIVSSTVKWVWKNFNKETFSKIQKARSNKRAVVKNAPLRDRAILDMVEAGFTVSEIAENLNIGYNASKTAISTAKKREALRNVKSLEV